MTGFVIEKSLAMDNVFVIAMIFAYFKSPGQFQHRVLFWGILGALVMRGTMIALGAALIEKYGVARVVLRRKEHYSKPATDALIDEMAKEVDIAIAALGG